MSSSATTDKETCLDIIIMSRSPNNFNTQASAVSVSSLTWGSMIYNTLDIQFTKFTELALDKTVFRFL